MKQLKSWLVVASAVLALAACGGGGGGSDATPPQQASPLDGMPVEATQSMSGWIGFLAALIKATAEEGGADDREPFVPTSPAPLPLDDESEPVSAT
jgi:ABC-type glycerol-3-phosphate transport system substrate-binding protein